MDSTIILKTGDAEGELLTGSAWPLPAILGRAGPAVILITEQFLNTAIHNDHTRLAYRTALRQFFAWCEYRDLRLTEIVPSVAADYFEELLGKGISLATRRQHLSALRRYFDALLVGGLVTQNPATPVHLSGAGVNAGTTPAIGVAGVRKLLASIDTSQLVGMRDLAVLSTLTFTAARVGAVSRLRCGDLKEINGQWILHFREKRGRLLDIPVTPVLFRILSSYIDGAGLCGTAAEAPLFRSAMGRAQTLTEKPFGPNEICRMMKHRLQDAGLPLNLSPHSIRVTTITSLLADGVPLFSVQRLAGHVDPRTTALYDRRPRNITAEVVGKIPV